MENNQILYQLCEVNSQLRYLTQLFEATIVAAHKDLRLFKIIEEVNKAVEKHADDITNAALHNCVNEKDALYRMY